MNWTFSALALPIVLFVAKGALPSVETGLYGGVKPEPPNAPHAMRFGNWKDGSS